MGYKRKGTGNKEIDKAVIRFDKQIKKEYIFSKGKKEKCVSYWNKILFLETFYLDINDWRKIRRGNYWDISDSLSGIEKIKFTTERVMNYLNKS
tara:strand:- start:59 stop:340 length:282 start_codon:yes stop_codon:yes gene_type:complete